MIDQLLLRDLIGALIMLCVIVSCLVYAFVVSYPQSDLERCSENFMSLDSESRSLLIYGCASRHSDIDYQEAQIWCERIGPDLALELIEGAKHDH